MHIRQVEGVLLEGQHRQLAGDAIELLAVAVDEEDARALFGLDEGAALGNDGDRLGLVALVLHEEAGHLAVRIAPADVDREVVRNRREGSFLEDSRHEFIADLELQILEGAVGRRHEIGG